MADIKTRDVTRGSIKTLDRAASSMHHLKEETIRSKMTEIRNHDDGTSANSYAQDTIEHYAGDSATYAAKAGTELMLRSRAGKSIDEVPHITPEIRGETGIGADVQRAFREQGIKTIRSQKEKSRMAEAEVDRTAESVRNTRRIRSVAARSPEDIHRIGRKSSVNIRVAGREDVIQKQRKAHAVDRIISRQSARTQNLIMMFRRSGKDGQRTVAAANSFVRYLWAHARSYILTLGAGGTAAVIILTLLVSFGIGTITFSNNSPDSGVPEDPEAIEYFIPDLAGSPTRQAIVKAAAKEVGNVGGEKFWRWYGFNGHVHWCACFTSYIAAECGCIQSGICPKDAGVEGWMNFYKKQHRWAHGNYIPHSGDFILFDWNGNGSPDHIGIVESCDGKTIYTIEGNSSNRCKRNTYSRGSVFILGYGCPNYSGK